MEVAEVKKKIEDLRRKGVSREDTIMVVSGIPINGESVEAFEFIDVVYQPAPPTERELVKPVSEKLQALTDCGLSMGKTNAEPPQYEFGLKGQPKVIRVTLRELHSKDMVDMAMFGAWDFHPLADITPKDWRAIIEEWMASGAVEVIDTGKTDLPSRIILAAKRFLEQRGEGTAYSDIESGSFVRRVNGGEDCYCFLPERLLSVIGKWLGRPVKAQDVEFALRKVGLRTGRDANPIRVGNPGHQFRPWVVPVATLDAVEFELEDKQAQLPEMEDDIPEF